MIRSKSAGSKVFTFFNTVLMIILAASCLYPLWYTFCLSVSAKEAVDAGKVVMNPIGFNLSSYSLIMNDREFFSSVWVSVQRVVLGTVISMVVMILIAYPLSKTNKEFKIRNICMWVLIFTMLFSGGTIPWFMTVKYYGLIDSIWALILSGSLPVFNVILIISFFRQLPKDLEEAAVVDGAGPWRILWGIVVPCSVPVLATVVLFVSVGHWNEYLQGLLFMNTPEKYPPSDIHKANSSKNFPGCIVYYGAISRIVKKFKQSFGCCKGIHFYDPYASGVSIYSKVFCYRHYAGSC